MVCVARETPPGCEYFHCLGERQMPSQLARIEGALGWSRPCPTPLFWGGGGGVTYCRFAGRVGIFFPLHHSPGGLWEGSHRFSGSGAIGSRQAWWKGSPGFQREPDLVSRLISAFLFVNQLEESPSPDLKYSGCPREESIQGPQTGDPSGDGEPAPSPASPREDPFWNPEQASAWARAWKRCQNPHLHPNRHHQCS